MEIFYKNLALIAGYNTGEKINKKLSDSHLVVWGKIKTLVKCNIDIKK